MAPATLAKGLLTFLFTDIVGSTLLWERAPQAARRAVARHYDIVRDVVVAHRGIIFKTVGDACCCVFDEPLDAVRAALAMQLAIAREAWPDAVGALQIRVAMHSGEAIAEDGDYFGSTLNRVARLVSAAHGGQIVLSDSTAQCVAGSLPAQCGLTDLGAHRLKDLAQPQRVFQLCAAGLPVDFPPLLTLDAQPNNLPSQLSTFVGREAELQALRDLLRQHRLVTLCGAGGIGKTRLALQAAAETIGTYAGGSWIVRLADIAEAELVAQTAAAALHIAGVPGQLPIDTLVSHLRDKQLFLLLDNAEHLLAAVAQFAGALAGACSKLTLLVTSREPLHIAGEQVLRIGPLAAQDARNLFLGRASLQQADAYVANICDELEGVPLAIELAAGRIGTLSTKQLAQRLETMLPALSSKDQSQEARHRTLNATIEWSYRLLNPKEQRFFALLAVFEGGFTLEACEAVAWAGEEDDPAYALLDALVDKSFVTAEPAGESMRYRLLESLNRFARAKLIESGEEPAARDLHFEYFKTIADCWDNWQSPEEEQIYLRELALELPNLRAALDWGLRREDPSSALEMVLAVARYWQQHCNVSEARSWLARACAAAGSAGSLHAKLLRRAATFATIEDDYASARDLTQRALEMFSQLEDRAGTAEALHNLAVIEQRSGSEERAYRLYAEALVLFEQTNHETGVITALYNLAQTAKRRGDVPAAKHYLERGTSLCVLAQHADRLASFWTLRAEIAIDECNYDDAGQALGKALDMKLALDDRHDQVEVLCNFGVLEMRRGDWNAAREYARKALRLAAQLDLPSLFIGCFELFAVMLKSSDASRAAEIAALAKALRRDHRYVYEILSELAPDLAAFAGVPAAPPVAREVLQRMIGELAGDYSL